MVSNFSSFGLPSNFGSALAGTGQNPLAAATSKANALNPLSGYQNAVASMKPFLDQAIANSQIRKLQKAAAAAELAAAQQQAAAAPGAAPNALPPGVRQAKIAQIDDFSTDASGFNHGQEVAKTLNPDGSAALVQYDVSGGGDRLDKISLALDDLIARVQQGETIDAVNISQQDFGNSPKAQAVRDKINQLSSLNVPVAVAAGNGGAGQRNSLAAESAFTVGSTTNGVRNANSGAGNVQAEGRTTSFATANFARQVAQQNASQQNVAQQSPVGSFLNVLM